MKELILFLTAVCFVGFSVKAEPATLGVKAGITGSNKKISASGVSMNMSTKIGYDAGVIADVNVADNFFVQPERYCSLTGAKVNGDGRLGLSNEKEDVS